MTTIAQKCFNEKNGEASKICHRQRAVDVQTNQESHGSAGEIIKSVVLGGLDGVITTFAIVCAVAGSGELSGKVVIMMGVANLCADAISMG